MSAFIHASSPFHPAHLPLSLGFIGGYNLDDQGRMDANETAVLSRSLEESAIAAVEHEYERLLIRELVPFTESIDPGADTYTWDEIQRTGSAEFVTNYGDDLVTVGQFITTNTGKVESIGNAYQYSTQDLRRVALANRKGLQASLSRTPAQVAVEFHERKTDAVGALGDTTRGLPGLLANGGVNINSATGTWAGGGATAAEIVQDLRDAINEIAVDSDGAFMADTVVAPVEDARFISTTPLLATGNNRITIWDEVVSSETKARGLPANQPALRLYGYHRCVGAGAGSVDRCMVYKRAGDVMGLVNPLRATMQPPQANGLHWSIPVESRIGGVLIKKPLACRYIDGV